MRPPNLSNPFCPSGHPGRVRKHGTYGAGSKRQQQKRLKHVHTRPRFLCVPTDRTLKKHAFTLARVLPRAGECAMCDRAFGPGDGPRAPKRFMHVVPDIAMALYQVGAGDTYSHTGQRTREATGVVRYHWKRRGWPEDGGRDWGLVADWVELYANLCTGPDLPKAWPSSGGLLLDVLPMSAGATFNPLTGRANKTGKVIWLVLCAMGPWGPRNQLRMLRMRAYGHTTVPGSTVPPPVTFMGLSRKKLVRSTTAMWAHFLSGLPGRPAFIISDQEDTIRLGAQQIWPGIERRVGFDHLELELEKKLAAAGHKQVNDPLWKAKGKWGSKNPNRRSCFFDLAAWNAFKVVIANQRYSSVRTLTRVDAWVKRNDQKITAQLTAMPYWPYTLGPLEKQEVRVGAWLEGRAHGLRNQWRTDLLLDLMTNELLGAASLRNYQRRIRTSLDQPQLQLPRHLIYASPRIHLG